MDRAIAEASTVLSIGAYIPYAVGYIVDYINFSLVISLLTCSVWGISFKVQQV